MTDNKRTFAEIKARAMRAADKGDVIGLCACCDLLVDLVERMRPALVTLRDMGRNSGMDTKREPILSIDALLEETKP